MDPSRISHQHPPCRRPDDRPRLYSNSNQSVLSMNMQGAHHGTPHDGPDGRDRVARAHDPSRPRTRCLPARALRCPAQNRSRDGRRAFPSHRARGRAHRARARIRRARTDYFASGGPDQRSRALARGARVRIDPRGGRRDGHRLPPPQRDPRRARRIPRAAIFYPRSREQRGGSRRDLWRAGPRNRDAADESRPGR